jgi:hypothetical protein
MPSIRLRYSEVSRKNTLPNVCMRCGGEAARDVSKNFSWYPFWVPFLILGGLIPFIVVAILLTKRMKVPVPLCQAHASHWSRRNWIIYGGLACVVLLCGGLFVAAALLSEFNRANPQRDNTLGGLLCVAPAVVFLAWAIIATIAQNSAIRPTEITDRSITLTNVSNDFIDAVEEQRDRAPRRRHQEDDYDDYDEYDDEDD